MPTPRLEAPPPPGTADDNDNNGMDTDKDDAQANASGDVKKDAVWPENISVPDEEVD